jgi:hypothetical protein
VLGPATARIHESTAFFNDTFTAYEIKTPKGVVTAKGRRKAAVAQAPTVPKQENPAFAATPAPASASSKPPETRIDELIERKNVIADDLFGPLNREVPASIREYLADLRENLLDEGARKPVASKEAYDLGARYCNGLIGAYDEREKMAARLRNNAPGGVAGVPTTTKVHPNWIDYLRERDEAAAASHNNTLETSFAKTNILQWRTRAAELRKTLDTFYVQFRAAARQPAAPR